MTRTHKRIRTLNFDAFRSNREEFLFGNIVAEPLRARPPSFEERLQCGTWQPTTIMEDM